MGKYEIVEFRSETSPGDYAIYKAFEAARILKLNHQTVRSWAFGRPAGEIGRPELEPLIEAADPVDEYLSFWNLVELHVVRMIRSLSIRMSKIRSAIREIRKMGEGEHPLLEQDLYTDRMHLFAKRTGNIVNLSQGSQLHFLSFYEGFLERIEWDDERMPRCLFPFLTKEPADHSPRLIAVDPRIRSGRPCISGTNLPTTIIAGRRRAGDSIDFLMRDYGRTREEIEQAIRYEQENQGRKAA